LASAGLCEFIYLLGSFNYLHYIRTTIYKSNPRAVEKYYQISCIEAGISKIIDNNNNSNYDVRKKPINCYTCNKSERNTKDLTTLGILPMVLQLPPHLIVLEMILVTTSGFTHKKFHIF